MCALTATEVAHRKDVFMAKDPNASNMISPLQEVLGQGFARL